MVDDQTEQLVRPPSVSTPLTSLHEAPIIKIAESKMNPREMFGAIRTEVDRDSREIFRSLLANGYQGADIHAFLDAAFGFLRLDKKIIFQSPTEKLDESEKEDSARVGQAMAHYMLYAQLHEAPNDLVDIIYESVFLNERLSQTRFGKLTHFSRLWSGVKSQVAVMSMLVDHGYEVHSPNYVVTDEIADDPENISNQVLHWDVRSGVDLIAVDRHETSQSRVILIDAKGRSNYQMGGEVQTRQVVSIGEREKKPVSQLNSSIRRAIRGMGIIFDKEDGFPWAQIFVPIQKSAKNLPFPATGDAARRAIRSLTPLTEQQTRPLLTSLAQMT